ncbi:hypothetical protein GYMLUDRAFT_909571 [Collybiopsis luxurians FD-317 M1]|nr:hypothetical protein GYMLUDRAFT_909571 [Collybiopsis luxurians FD-317 M1]
MSDAVTIVLDNTVITVGPGGFDGRSTLSMFNSTSFALNGSLSLSFHGTSIAFIGGVAELGNRTSTTFDLDISLESDFHLVDSPEYPPSISPQTVFQWYTSPSLPDTSDAYNIQLSNLQQAGVDYVLIEAGANTPLTDQTILVDDNSPEIIWNGHWTNQSEFTSFDGLVHRPNGNGTHSSSTVGDSFEFQFAGTSIAVAGVLAMNEGDSFAASFNLDNRNFTYIPFREAGTAFNYVYFSDSFSAGNHTLTVNLTQVTGNAAFVVDYLMYKPTFDFLSQKPNFTQPSATNGSGSSGTGPSATSSLAQHHANVAAIVGGVIGGVCFIALGMFLYICQRKRQQRREYEYPKISADIESSFTVDPLTIESSYEQSPETKIDPSTRLSSVGMTLSERQAALQRHADELAELERERERRQEMLTYSVRASSSSLALAQTSVPTLQSTQEQISDLNARIERLTRLMREQSPPPAYDQDGRSQV